MFALIKRIPVISALGVHLSSFFSIYILGILAFSLVDYTLTIEQMLMLYVASTMAFTSMFKMDIWWKYINAAFPVVVCLMLKLNIPSWIFMVAFILTAATFWTTFKTRVPFYRSSKIAIEHALTEIPERKHQQILDLGSGIGDFSIRVSKRRPFAYVTGVEIAPLPFLLSCLINYFKKSKAEFKLCSYENFNFADYDVIYAYLSPAAMDALFAKALREMKDGALLISHEFPVNGVEITKKIKDELSEKITYFYRFPRQM